MPTRDGVFRQTLGKCRRDTRCLIGLIVNQTMLTRFNLVSLNYPFNGLSIIFNIFSMMKISWYLTVILTVKENIYIYTYTVMYIYINPYIYVFYKYLKFLKF